MIPFKDISIQDKMMVQTYTLTSNRRNCDLSFANLYSWRFLYHTQVAEQDGFLLIKFRIGGKAAYMMPVGDGDLHAALRAMKEDAEREGDVFCMYGVCSHMRADLEEAAPDCFTFTADRDYYDYIYLRTDLDRCYVFDHVTIQKMERKDRHITLTLHNPTAFDATVTILAENAAQAALPLGDNAFLQWNNKVTVKAGRTAKIKIPR